MSRRTITPPSRPFARGKRGILVALTSLAGLSALGAAGCEATFSSSPATAWEADGAWVTEDVPSNIT